MVDPNAFAEPWLTAALKDLREARSQIESLERHSTMAANRTWQPVGEQGRFHQRLAHFASARMAERGGFLLALDVPSRKREFDYQMDQVDFVIRQENNENLLRYYGPDVFKRAAKALTRIETLLDEALGPASNWPVLVPDTNVLIDLVRHGADGASEVDWKRLRGSWSALGIWIVPPVVRELDELKLKLRKNEGRTGNVQAAIRELEAGFTERRLGASDGSLTVHFHTAELNRSDTEHFPWFDGQRMDHRILAATLDVARRNPRDGVYLVTSDLHMKLLAKYLGITLWPDWSREVRPVRTTKSS